MNDPAPDEFIARWRQDELTERSASRPHFNDLCRLPDPPDPITDDPKGEWFTFENGAARTTGSQDHGRQGPDRCPAQGLLCPGNPRACTRTSTRPLLQHALAHDLATFLSRIELPEAMADRSLTRLQPKLIRIGARVLRHAPAIPFHLAEVAVTGAMVRAPLAAIRRWRAPPCRARMLTESEQKRQDRSVRLAEKPAGRIRMKHIRGIISPDQGIQANADAASRSKRLIS